MVKYALMFLFAIFIWSVSGQNFEGKITFEISVMEQESMSDQKGKSVVFIKDSLMRSENDSQLGKQIMITNINTGATHLMMNYMGKDYAIIMENDTSISKRYTFEESRGKNKIQGHKCDKFVYQKDGKDLEAWTTDEISGKYNNGSFRQLDGFALSYSIPDQGVIFQYHCTEIINYKEDGNTLSDQLFTIPPQYEIIALEDFMGMVQKKQENQ